MFLIDLYIRWKVNRELKAWTKFKKTHFYVDEKGSVNKVETDKPIGVTMGWGGEKQLCFEGGKVYFNARLDKIFHPEYFIEGEEWAVDPITKEKLPIYKPK